MRIIERKFVFVALVLLLSGFAVIVRANALRTPEKVSEGVFRGPHPGEADLRELSRMGIRTVLSLEDDPSVVAEEGKACQSFNIDFVNIPLSEVAPPSADALTQAVNIIQEYRDRGIYVHCRRGIDRTGYVIAAFRMLVEKCDLDKAYKECCDHGHSKLIYFFWKGSLKKIWKEALPVKAGNHAPDKTLLPDMSAAGSTPGPN